jgi:hypothetical protein
VLLGLRWSVLGVELCGRATACTRSGSTTIGVGVPSMVSSHVHILSYSRIDGVAPPIRSSFRRHVRVVHDVVGGSRHKRHVSPLFPAVGSTDPTFVYNTFTLLNVLILVLLVRGHSTPSYSSSTSSVSARSISFTDPHCHHREDRRHDNDHHPHHPRYHHHRHPLYGLVHDINLGGLYRSS